MNPEDAEEYTKALSQIVDGVLRQMAEGARLGVPNALGLSDGEWVETRLGGPLRTGVPEQQGIPMMLGSRYDGVTGGQKQRALLPRPMSQATRRDLANKAEPASSGDGDRTTFLRSLTLRQWSIIVLCAALGGLAGAVWAALTPPSYVSQAAVFVSLTSRSGENPTDGDESLPNEDPFGASQFVLQRTQSYGLLATSPLVLEDVAQELHRSDVAELRRKVQVSSSGGAMLWVSVKDRDPQAAAQTADSVIANLTRSVAVIEGDGRRSASPVRLVPVQPTIVPVASARSGGVVKSLLGVLAGLALGGTAFRFIQFRHDRKRHRSTDENAEPTSHPEAAPERHRIRAVAQSLIGRLAERARR